MRDVLKQSRVIAVVGHSDNPSRTSYQIAQFLRGAGYIIYPVNPTVDTIDGQKCYATLADVPEKIDLVNVFRRSEYLASVVDDAIANSVAAVWAQLGVHDTAAKQKALDAGIAIATNACIKVEYVRLGLRKK
ncbi:MAG: CoA-binding protein [Anaerolineae bacterium]|nr:CoA-binding protein [Anaerolineae bacterium]